MKIRKIQFANHPVLGNLDIDFTKPDGSVYGAVIIVGENGAGKTTLLKWISDINKLHHTNKKIDYTFNLECVTDMPKTVCGYPQPGVIAKMWNTSENTKVFNYDPVTTDHVGNKTILSFRAIYCQGASKIYPKNIELVTTNRGDEYDLRDQENDIATFIKQLIINYDAADANDLLNWVRENPNAIPPEEIKEPRIKEITQFIEPIFDNIQYKKVITHSKVVNGMNSFAKDVVFSKNGKDVFLDDMASGEKQIIFRTMSLLYNTAGHESSSTELNISIDEPEISIHPKWQGKIFEAYKEIAKSRNAQLFIATHSEHIIKKALESGDLIIILNESDDGGVVSKRLGDLKLNSIHNTFKPTYSQIIYEVFGIPTGEFHNELYQYIETESGKPFDDALPADFPVDRERKTPTGAIWRNKKISMPSYIRHQFNHPNLNNSYTEQELINSIESMKNVIQLQKI